MSNAGFESGFVDWTTFTGTETITNNAFAGSNALALSSTGSGVDQSFSAVAGDSYTLTAQGRTTSPDWSGIGISFFDANWTFLEKEETRITGESWAEYTVDAIAPTGAANGIIWSWKDGDRGITVIDDLGINGTTPPIAGNLLQNSSFEANLSNWDIFNTAGTTTTTDALDGDRALALSDNGSGASQVVTITPERSYELSWSAKTNLNSGAWVGAGVDLYDANWNQLDSQSTRLTASNWTNYQIDLTASSEAIYAVPWFSQDSNSGVTTIDQVSFRETDAAPADTIAPSPSFTDVYLTTSGSTSYDFDVEFDDNVAVDVSTLDSNDIRIVGPNGFSQLAQFVGVNNNTDGPSRTATYRITPPGGGWDNTDNGIYSVELRANQVGDTSGNVSSAATLGNIDVTLEGRINLGNLNQGVAARDGATGTGYLMYSEELLFARFPNNPPYSSTDNGDNANNLIAVVFQNGQWYYDDNSNLRAFTPRSTDLLLAELDFDADTATLLQGQNRLINGISAGYESGDLTVTPNVWDGGTGGIARGEFGVTGTYVAVNDDGLFEGQLSLASPTIDIDENSGTLSVSVNRTDGSDGRVTVDYATSDVSATAGQDFTSTAGTLVFADGQTSATIQVPIINDTDSEEDETFFINLSNPTGGASIGNSGTVVTILNDDAPPRPGNPGDLLPDVTPIARTLTEDLRLDTRTLSGRTILRLSTEVANVGEGPLEIWGGSASGDSQPVFQRIYNDTGGSRDVLAGEFVYHPSHGHIHFEGFASYSLRQVTSGGGVGSIIASGGKTSFCLINIRQPFPELTNSAQVWNGRGGDNCGQIQGIDVGYSDVYSANLPDQWIDVTNVADGTYWLEAIADPDNNMLELDETNNVERVQITLNNGRVSS